MDTITETVDSAFSMVLLADSTEYNVENLECSVPCRLEDDV